jgi:hypothetical protein
MRAFFSVPDLLGQVMATRWACPGPSLNDFPRAPALRYAENMIPSGYGPVLTRDQPITSGFGLADVSLLRT